MNTVLKTLDLLKAVVYALEREAESCDTRSEVISGLSTIACDLVDKAIEVEGNSPDWADRKQ